MKKFLIKLILYLFSIIIVCYTVQYFVDAGFYKYTADDYLVWNKIFFGKAEADIIINGSSRALVEFDPKIIEDSTHLTCFNIGVNGGELTTIKSRWDSYLAYNKKPKFLIKNFDIILFDEENFIVNKEKYLPYLSKYTVSSNLETIDAKIWLEKIIPLFKYRGLNHLISLGIKSYFNMIDKIETKSYKGYTPVNKNWDYSFAKIKARHKKGIFIPDKRFQFGFKYFIELNNECKKSGVKLIIVHAPMYYELQEMLPQMDSIINVMEQLARKNHFQFWDYSKDSLSFSKEYSYNSEHLNKKGAEIFSKQLASDLKKFIYAKK